MQPRDTRSIVKHSTQLSVWLASLIVLLLAIPSETAAQGFPLKVRFSGKLYLLPTGEPNRHRDLLALGISKEEEIYLQVDEFHTSSRAQSELSVLREMRRHEPNIRVINAEILAPLLTDEHIQKPVLLSGFFYRMSGQLTIVSAFLEGEEETPLQPDKKTKPKGGYW